MKIRTISVYGLFGRHDHTVNVFGDGITYIHSPNGCGKSTLIKMIYMLFTGDTEGLRNVMFERMDVSLSDDTNIIVERTENELFIQMQRNELETEISADELSSILRTTYISAERTFASGAGGRTVGAVETYAHELSSKLIAAKRDRKLIVPSYDDDMMGDELVFRAKDLNAKLNFIRDAGFDIDIPSGLRFPPTRYDLMESEKEYKDLIHGIGEFVGRNYYLSESVIVLKDIVNGFLFDKDMKIDENDHIVFSLDNGTTLPLANLSSGEKQIFIMFYRMLFETPPSSFVMIDEPEISLHVSWQQRMGHALKDVARLRDLQILVATHSPQIVHDDWDLTNELEAGRA
ncbi:MAG: ATP-binding protein [Methanomassiliicoccaceae archaeon]|nr:ATP-binding protein [Methanomassiliicoccaceae archaeon]